MARTGTVCKIKLDLYFIVKELLHSYGGASLGCTVLSCVINVAVVLSLS